MKMSPQTALRVLNIAIIAVSLILGGLLIRRYLLRRSTQNVESSRPDEYLREGSRFPVLNLDWSKKDQTLLIILQKGCGYCEQSAPFYQRIKQGLAARNDISLVAILPDWTKDPEGYLKRLGISVDDVRQISLRTLARYGLAGTPALVIVNKQGLVMQLWTGKLTANQEYEVLNSLHLPNDGAPSSSVANGGDRDESTIETINEAELQRLTNSGQPHVVVDLRDRERYEQDGGVMGSKNIPFDELKVRAVNELSASDLIVVYGGTSDDKLDEKADVILKGAGFSHVLGLRTSSAPKGSH